MGDIRSYREDDAPAVAAFFDASHAADPTVLRVPVDEWRGFTRMSFNFDARDFLVAEDEGGDLVGLATSIPSGDVRHFRIFVRPDRRRRGLATRLLRRVEQQDAPPAAMTCGCEGSWEAGAAFLRKNGFQAEHRALQMERTGPPPAPTEVAGVVLRPYAGAADDAAWKRLADEGFSGTPGHVQLTDEDLALNRETPGFSLWLAEQDGDIVGLCHSKTWHEKTVVNSVVVTRAFRGRGLGRALLLAGMRSLAADTVTLWVDDDNANAIALYRSVGFRKVEETVTWRKEHPASSV